MRQIAQQWSRVPLDQRCQQLELAVQEIKQAVVSGRAGFLEGLNSFAGELLGDTLDACNADSLVNAVRQAQQQAPGARAPRVTLQIAAGTVFTAWIHPALLTLAAGSTHILKPASSDDPRLAQQLARALHETTGWPILAIQGWRGGDDPQEAGFLRHADALIAQGDDTSMAEIQRELPSQTPRLLYGHRYSLGVLHLEDDPLGPQAQGMLRDVLAYNGLGCLSPRALVLLGSSPQKARLWVDSFASGWNRALRRFPAWDTPLPGERFALHGFYANAKISGRVHGSPDTPLAIGSPKRVGLAPPGPSLAVWPLRAADLRQGWTTITGDPRIQGIAVSDRARRALKALPSDTPAYQATPGQLQRPPIDWPHDGEAPLSPLFGQLEPRPLGG